MMMNEDDSEEEDNCTCLVACRRIRLHLYSFFLYEP